MIPNNFLNAACDIEDLRAHFSSGEDGEDANSVRKHRWFRSNVYVVHVDFDLDQLVIAQSPRNRVRSIVPLSRKLRIAIEWLSRSIDVQNPRTMRYCDGQFRRPCLP